MSGLIKQVWQVCGIVFVLLLPYIVWRRRLWLPGMVAVSYETFAKIKLTSAILGPIRVMHLWLIAELLIIGAILVDSMQRVRLRRPQVSAWDRAPVYIIFLLFLIAAQIVVEAVLGDPRLLLLVLNMIVGTLLPCVIVAVHPPEKGAFAQIMTGVALGALLALLPAFVDLEGLSSVWEQFRSGSTIYPQQWHYRDRNTVASYALQGGMALFCLAFLGKRRVYYYIAAACQGVLAVITQSRRWIVSLAAFSAFFYVQWARGRGALGQSVPSRRGLWLPWSMVVGGLLLYGASVLFGQQSPFDRYTFESLVAELGSSAGVQARWSRGDLWRSALAAWQKNPLFGVGLSGWGWNVRGVEAGTGAVQMYHIGAHNLAVDILVQYGIVGAVLCLVFLWGMTRFLARWLRQGNDGQLRRDLWLLTICWVCLFPAAIFGGWNTDNLYLLALLPCAARLVVLGYVECAPSGGSWAENTEQGRHQRTVGNKAFDADRATGG